MSRDDDDHADGASNGGPASDEYDADDLDDLLEDLDELDEDLEPRVEIRAKPNVEEDMAWRAERLARLRQSAQDLENYLQNTPRLSVSDRRAIVRNFGRLIERRFRGQERETARQIFHRAYSEESARNMDKKRKRFFRFDREPLPANAPHGEYCADGRTFRKLYQAFCAECGEKPETEAAWRTLAMLCDRASFASSSATSVASTHESRERFQACLAQMLDRLARETDIIGYFSEIRRNRILSYPEKKGDFTAAQLDQLPLRRWLPSRFELLSSVDLTDRWMYQGKDFFNSDLLPQVRLARIYWPRRVLCLPIGVETSTLEAAVRVSARDQAAAIWQEKSGRDRNRVLRELRETRRQDCLRAAMRERGLDPDEDFWEDFVDPETGEALDGASWWRFYQIRTYDLVLTSVGSPDNLQLVLQTDERWTHCPNTLCTVKDDEPGAPELLVELGEYRELVTLPANGMEMICRPLCQLTEDDKEIEFQDRYHPVLNLFRYSSDEPVEIDSAPAWQLLSMPMVDYRKDPRDSGTRYPDEDLPCLRTCFSAPEGWTPAPEGSLASAMMRSLAHGSDPERLDTLLREAINTRVSCLEELQADLERQFQAGLRRNGYEA